MASSEPKYEVVEYPCHICNFTSTNKHDLLKHLKSKHLSIQMYYCYHCDYKSRDKGDLLTHTKSKHKRVGSYMNTKIEHKEGRLDPKATEKQTIFSKLPLQVKRDRVGSYILVINVNIEQQRRIYYQNIFYQSTRMQLNF